MSKADEQGDQHLGLSFITDRSFSFYDLAAGCLIAIPLVLAALVLIFMW